jgi:hypothetical protein
MTTPNNIKVQILGDLWMDYRDEEEFQDFCQYNDLGLPLAYMIASDIVAPTPMSDSFINETFDLLLAALDIKEDEGYETLDDVLGTSI